MILVLWQKSESFKIYSITSNIFEPTWMPAVCLFLCAFPISFFTTTNDFEFLPFVFFFPNCFDFFGDPDLKCTSISFLLMHASFCSILMLAVQIAFQIPLGYDLGNKRLI